MLEEAVVAQLVERVLGKDEVTGSSPVNGSSFSPVSNPDRLRRANASRHYYVSVHGMQKPELLVDQE
jgi:hypothetical protein